jgi:hypothetical protein
MKRGKPIPKYFIGTPATAPSVTTNAATDVAITTATGNGNITSDGGAAITARGFVFSVKSVNSDPLIGGTGVTNIVEGGTDTGVFSDTLETLEGGTLYTYKAYATNSKGTGYGAATDFTTEAPLAPTVTTQAVSDIGENTATGNGNVTSDGGATVTERGVVANTTGTPITDDLKFAAGAGGTGVYTASMTGLDSETHYFVRAYAINTVGTSYGGEVEFDTESPPSSEPVTQFEFAGILAPLPAYLRNSR